MVDENEGWYARDDSKARTINQFLTVLGIDFAQPQSSHDALSRSNELLWLAVEKLAGATSQLDQLEAVTEIAAVADRYSHELVGSLTGFSYTEIADRSWKKMDPDGNIARYDSRQGARQRFVKSPIVSRGRYLAELASLEIEIDRLRDALQTGGVGPGHLLLVDTQIVDDVEVAERVLKAADERAQDLKRKASQISVGLVDPDLTLLRRLLERFSTEIVSFERLLALPEVERPQFRAVLLRAVGALRTYKKIDQLISNCARTRDLKRSRRPAEQQSALVSICGLEVSDIDQEIARLVEAD